MQVKQRGKTLIKIQATNWTKTLNFGYNVNFIYKCYMFAWPRIEHRIFQVDKLSALPILTNEVDKRRYLL